MKKTFALSTLLPLSIASTFAADGVDLTLLKKSINPAIEIKGTKPSAIPGLYEVQVNNQIVYLSADGEKVISGDMYDLKKQFSHTERATQTLRKDAMASVEDKDKIIYKAKNEKYKVSVFTDISCPYCTKLHQHMSEFNDMGITVEYLAFPRAGLGSQPAKRMQKIWCAENKTIAMNQAKLDNKIPKQSCNGSQVVEQFLLGQDIGVNATPTIIFEDGSIQPGYAEPKELLQYLQSQPKS